jgi:CYTH domain-containing protein
VPEGDGGPADDALLRAAQAWLTLKAPSPRLGDERVRLEFEYPIPPADAEALLALAPQQVLKRRHGLDLPGGDWVLDVFEAANAPLVVAEVELADPDQPVSVPAWCVRELTGRHELSNAALALRPLQTWPAEERAALWGE